MGSGSGSCLGAEPRARKAGPEHKASRTHGKGPPTALLSPPAVPGWPYIRPSLTTSPTGDNFLRKINVKTPALGKSQEQHSNPSRQECPPTQARVHTRVSACRCSPTCLHTAPHTLPDTAPAPALQLPPDTGERWQEPHGGHRARQEAERRPGDGVEEESGMQKGAGEKTRERESNSLPGGQARLQAQEGPPLGQRVSGEGVPTPAPSPQPGTHAGLPPRDSPLPWFLCAPIFARHLRHPRLAGGGDRRGCHPPSFQGKSVSSAHPGGVPLTIGCHLPAMHPPSQAPHGLHLPLLRSSTKIIV